MFSPHNGAFDVDTLLDLAVEYVPEGKSIDYAVVDYEIETDEQLYNVISNLPGRARGLLRLINEDIKEWIADPEIKGSRYQTVFKSTLHLSVLSFMPPWAIKQIIKNEIIQYDFYDGVSWDKAQYLDDYIDKAIAWGKSCEARI